MGVSSDRPVVIYGRPPHAATAERGACIRFGGLADALAGSPTGTRVLWVSLADAEAMAGELAAAIAQARAAGGAAPPAGPSKPGTAFRRRREERT